MSYIVILFLFVLLLLFTMLLVYLVFFKKSKINYIKLIDNEIDVNTNFSYHKTVNELVKRNKLTLPNKGNNIIITWQMYIVNIGGEYYWSSNFNKDKSIFKIGNSPHIYYNPKQNKLKIICKYQYSPFTNHFPLIELDNIMQQSWVTYTVVFNNLNVIIYVNGKMMINRKLENSIIIDDKGDKNIILGEYRNNIFGKIRKFNIYINDLSHYELERLNI